MDATEKKTGNLLHVENDSIYSSALWMPSGIATYKLSYVNCTLDRYYKLQKCSAEIIVYVFQKMNFLFRKWHICFNYESVSDGCKCTLTTHPLFPIQMVKWNSIFFLFQILIKPSY